ncbi:MAG: prepilin peptidase [Desulfobacula sp.]|uniref:prepilin peptidase n=1 Tax=Desulfobacula sp. TaxID=2593537 RepID=UPI001D2CF833|nr:prepilin peptidase [Desulfobacula sp.]MBT7049166.1 prepilin peptidase [Desulfobacula sp.]MBT7792147.1 prepilin peptidase [Desulfobacula sp.]
MIIFDHTSYFAVFIFIIGACIGSFLNVCIYRIPENNSIITPGSFCPACKKGIPFYCNIPVLSYLFLKGRCKFCHEPISIRYPLIEILAGMFAVVLFYKFGIGQVMIYWFIFTSVLITISFIDIDHQIIPDVISLPGILVFASSFYFLPEMTLKNTLLGIVAGGGSLYAVAFLYYLLKKQEGMGGGDIKLLAMIGAAIGIKGVFFTIFAGSLLGTFFGLLIMIYTKIADSKLKIPFGPFLSMGAILYIFFGEQLILWYLGILRT